MEDYLKKIVPEWQDDLQMELLFSDFKHMESSNPEVYNSRLYFWSHLIQNLLKNGFLGSSIFTLQCSNLKMKFRRKGLTPTCLDHVILKLYQDSKKTSVIDSLIEKLSQVLLVDNMTKNIPKSFLVLNILNEYSSILSASSWPFDSLNLIEFKNYTNNLFSKYLIDEDIIALLNHMLDKKMIVVRKVNSLDRFINIVNNLDDELIISKLNANKFSPQEAFIRYTIKILSDFLQNLSHEQTRTKHKIREMKTHNIAQLKYELIKTKRLERVYSDKLNQLGNLEEALLKLQNAQSDVNVIKALSAGNKTLKTILKDLDLDNIHDLMLDISEQVNLVTDINAVIGKTQLSEEDEQDLQKELESLLIEKPSIETDENLTVYYESSSENESQNVDKITTS